MVDNHFRWDFIGLSTDTKPTPATSSKVVDGSTFYCSDNSKLYVYCKNQWYEKTATGGSGTSDFEQLTNRPKYNGTTMTGETNIPEVVTYSNFTGTDGTSAGTSGLVPAPATTDAGKFLKADGTWDTAGGSNYTAGDGIDITNDVISATNTGKAKILTTDNYNWPTSGTATSVALWLLEPGVYYAKNGVSVKASQTSSTEDTGSTSSGGVFIVGERRTNNYGTIIYYSSYASKAFMFEINFSNGGSSSKQSMIAPTVVQTTGTSTTDVMSQNATSSMVFSDPATKKRVAIGAGAISSTDGAIAIGPGGYSAITGVITVDSADSSTYPGFNSTRYRIIRGLHDAQYAHDAATKGQLDTAILNGGTTAPTTATVGAVGTLYSYVDTTGTPTPHMMVCTEVSGSTYTWATLI